jgi:hypothetical protein
MSLDSELKNLTELAIAGVGIDPNPEPRLKPFKKGNVPWNKGLSKETDPRLARAGENRKVSSMIDRKVNKLFNDQQAILDQHSRILDKIDRYVTTAQLNQRYEEEDDRPAKYASRRRGRRDRDDENAYQKKVDKPLAVNEEVLKQKYPELYDKVINRTYDVKDKGLRDKYPDLYEKYKGRRGAKSYSSYSSGGGMFSGLMQGALDIGMAGIGLAPFNEMFGLSSKIAKVSNPVEILKEIRDKLKGIQANSDAEKKSKEKSEKRESSEGMIKSLIQAIAGFFGNAVGGAAGAAGGAGAGAAAAAAGGGLWPLMKNAAKFIPIIGGSVGTYEFLKHISNPKVMAESEKRLKNINASASRMSDAFNRVSNGATGTYVDANGIVHDLTNPSIIAKAAKQTGVPLKDAFTTTILESNFKANAKNKHSTAKGLMQITDPTFKKLVTQNASLLRANGIDPATADPNDPLTNALLGLAGSQADSTYLESLGYPANSTNRYLTHLLGRPTAVKFLEALKNNPSANAAAMFPNSVKGNEVLFGRGTFSLEQMYQGIGASTSLIEKALEGSQKFEHNPIEGLPNVTRPHDVNQPYLGVPAVTPQQSVAPPQAITPEMSRSDYIDDIHLAALKGLTNIG